MSLIEVKAEVFDLLRQKEIIEVRLQQALKRVSELEKESVEKPVETKKE